MNVVQKRFEFVTRRHFLQRCNTGIGALALASLMGKDLLGATAESSGAGSSGAGALPFGPTDPTRPMLARNPMIAPRAKRVMHNRNPHGFTAWRRMLTQHAKSRSAGRKKSARHGLKFCWISRWPNAASRRCSARVGANG